MKIMIVDDNRKMRAFIHKFLCIHLKDAPEVCECDGGAEAIRDFPNEQPDWILMDLKMEPVNGLEASRSILKQYPEARIIAVTQFDEPVYREEAQDCGIRAYVLKENLSDIPVLLKDLL